VANEDARRSKILFTDWRDIQCGHLRWLNAGGEQFGVGNPPGEQVEMYAVPQNVPHGIRLQAEPARKTEKTDEYKGWGRVIFEEGKYRSWYLEINGHFKLGTGSAAHAEPPRSVCICRIESEDGLQWSEPQKCEIEVPGQRSFDGLTFFVDPVADEEERYKFVYCAQADEELVADLMAEYLQRQPRHRDWRVAGGRLKAIFAASSPDGLRWRPYRRPLMMHMSDTDTTVLWDESIERYVMYTRMMRQGRRWIGRAEAEDFMHWGPVEPIIWPRLDDPPDYDFYLNAFTRYPTAPQYRLMFPMVYHRFTERSEVRLYSSEDGIAWHEVPGGPVLEPGKPGEWDGEFIHGGKDLVPFGEGRIAIPYGGTNYPHKYPRWPAVWDAWSLGWAWWPQDRLCAVVADRVGEFCTMPVVPAGGRLQLNFVAPRGGEIRVGLDGIEGRGVDDCDPMHGDCMAHTVTWGGEQEMRVPPGRPITLRFRLRCAKLFSVSFV